MTQKVLEQRSETQSELPLQWRPVAHLLHVPPQSLSLSMPFLVMSMHDAGAHVCCIVQTPVMHCGPVLHSTHSPVEQYFPMPSVHGVSSVLGVVTGSPFEQSSVVHSFMSSGLSESSGCVVGPPAPSQTFFLQ